MKHSRSKGIARLVAVAIAGHADENGRKAWPSIPTLSREAGVSERGVYRALRELSSMGELKTTSGGGRTRSNRYCLILVAAQKELPFQETVKPCQGVTPCQGVSKTLTRCHPNSPEESKPKESTAQPRRDHSPELIRRIEAKNGRLSKEAEAFREAQAGRNWISENLEIQRRLKAIAAKKGMGAA
jgi:hypothetical protein